MSSRVKYFIVSSSTCLTLLLLIGSVMGRGASNPDDTYKHISVFSDVVSRIKSEYVEEPDMKSVTLGALNGLLEAIDPFASYLNADQYKEYLKTANQKRADVGLILSKKSGYGISVVAAVPNSAAAKAGLSTFDMVESIKGISTRDMPLAYANMLLQGEAGSAVEMSVVRLRRGEPQAVKLTRAIPSLPPVTGSMLANQVGYINVDALTAPHVKELASTIQKLQKEGAQKLVVDVRNCALGTPDDGIAAANLFLNKGRITWLLGQRVPRQNFDADPSKAITTLPVAVLTNRGTADAAELMASALAGNKRAEVVGERTYGDAAVRKAVTMDDGSAIILSVAKYYSPDGKAIQDTGVVPGTQVADDSLQVDVDETGAPVPETQDHQDANKKTQDDPVVKKALEVLAK
jgi:carboxyl-terminal processing protease